MSMQPAVQRDQSVLIPMSQVAIVQTATFAAAIFVSAFLLFQVQPLIGKFILPWFGGSPAVWTTCMLFFQVILFLGYSYAHAITRFLSGRQQRAIHLALIVLALCTLPIIPDSSWKPTEGAHPTGRILLLLSVTVGVSYFVLSSTGPLLQVWFSHVCPGRSPYRLYSLSNAGSLLALISYPLVVEPLWPIAHQAGAWSGLFVVFALLSATCAFWAGSMPKVVRGTASDQDMTNHPTVWRQTLWLTLPACSCLMLLATTNQVTQDVAPIPFLWVVPLCLYLLSFIICFDHEAWYRRGIIAPVTAASLFLVAGLQEWPGWFGLTLSTIQELFFYFVALFGVCMVCHGEVVRLRPGASYLTEFYLMLSAGGALGGVLVSLIAPRVFTTYFEWPLGLCVSFAIAAVVGAQVVRDRLTRTTRHDHSATSHRNSFSFPVGLSAIAGIQLLALSQIAVWQFNYSQAIYRNRNFYGTVRVYDSISDGGQPFRSFMSGHINHGQQWTSAEKRRLPTSYYGEQTACGMAFEGLKDRPSLRIGVIGLGVGTIATYARPSDNIRFYEINPEVEFIARTHFKFLSDCCGRCDVVLSDARLALEREAPNQYDLFIIDAFTSDAPPIHLLTHEAFKQYARHVRPDGLLLVNVTNTYLELAPVIARLGEAQGWKSVRIRTPYDPERLRYRTDYVVFFQDRSMFPSTANLEMMPEEMIRAAPFWTDQYSNLVQVLKRD